ncbi:MAG: hypothetical protein AAB676_05280 [Verrucomicrobiota bacterium]
MAISAVSALAADEPPASLAKPLEPFRPFIGKAWKGPFRNSTPEKPVYDVMKWERALNGQAVRILHSVNQGEYGGETIIVWNRKTECLEFHYFTTAGFFTQGTIKFEERKMISHEKVTGSQGGVTEVNGTMEILPNGRLHSKSRYLQNGQWVDGHEITYEESPGAEVRFK